ncbi:type I restriction enzyme, S subunit [Granulicatella balaenopterae]|uniref:Type I restriction enzyme, S subunit n=1 Tax=Granulicatella balaenopterae TaxID=137733 RepID=A0A1H9NI19_9LACT|nr:type I restriction enzyme, S subunit [Granulicatella balaenopterae]
MGDIGEIITGSTPKTTIKENYSKNGLPWITPTDICQQITFTSNKKLSEMGVKVARVVPKNTLLVTCIASIGKNTLLGTRSSFNQQINALIPKSNYHSYFLLIDSISWSIYMKRLASSATMQIVNKTDFSKIVTNVPSLGEQQQIGEFFQKQDQLITFQQRLLKN